MTSSGLTASAYRADLEQWFAWDGATVLVRPVRPQDAEEHHELLRALEREDLCPRTLTRLPDLAPERASALCAIDYDREMTFIAIHATNGDQSALGLVRSVVDAGNDCAEFAMALRPDVKGRGLGRILLGKLIAYYRTRQTRELVGEARADDVRRLQLARAFWFDVAPSGAPGRMTLRLTLGPLIAAN